MHKGVIVYTLLLTSISFFELTLIRRVLLLDSYCMLYRRTASISLLYFSWVFCLAIISLASLCLCFLFYKETKEIKSPHTTSSVMSIVELPLCRARMTSQTCSPTLLNCI